MARDPCCIGAKQVILHSRPVRSDNNEIGLCFLGYSQNLSIDTRSMRDENVGFEVGSIDMADQGSDPVLKTRFDQLIAEGCRFGLQDRLDLTHNGEDMKPGAEGARELDRRQQRLPKEVSSLRSMASRMFLYMYEPRTERRQTDLQLIDK